MVEIKIATWNLCLGLTNKKDYVTEIIKEKKIDICCMQETDVKNGKDTNLLTFRGYNLYLEKNTIKSRCSVYVKNDSKHQRRVELEGDAHGL